MKKLKLFFKEITNKKFLISISCLMLVQAFLFSFVKYFQSNYHVINYFIDSKIPFIPEFIYIYNIFYPFIFIVMYYIFCRDRKTYYNGVIAGIIGYLICDIIFLSYPTIMNRPIVDYSTLDIITGFIIKVTYFVDNPALNCLPSIHCLFCFQAMFTLIMSKNVKSSTKIIISFVLFLIILSTLFVKQHYLFDVIAAFIVFTLSNLVVYIFKLEKKLYLIWNNKVIK